MAGYQELSTLLKEELDQLNEEGRILNMETYSRHISDAGNDLQALEHIYCKLESLPRRPDFAYREPTAYDEIQQEATLGNTVSVPADDDTLFDRIYGAWLGRCAGCALGQPVELWGHEGIRTWCEKADAWPINGYLPTHSRAETEDNMRLNSLDCTKDVMHFMPTDDDIRYTILGLTLLQTRGFDWDTWDVGDHWVRNLPFRMLCTAENQAYLNFCNLDAYGPWGKKPTQAAELARSCAVYHNPYREWIGAQIRIDAYGYAAAGDPHLAARLAWEDATFSHVGNGVYSAMFFAALIAAAFSTPDIRQCIQIALNEIPTSSRFHQAIMRACKIGRDATSAGEVISAIQEAFSGYNVVHAINNSALCVAALVYANGDFETALTLSVAGGMDTDCNGATVGSVMGAFVGARQIPAQWTAPLNDMLYSQLPDYHPIAISQLAHRTLEVYRRNRLNK